MMMNRINHFLEFAFATARLSLFQFTVESKPRNSLLQLIQIEVSQFFEFNCLLVRGN